MASRWPLWATANRMVLNSRRCMQGPASGPGAIMRVLLLALLGGGVVLGISALQDELAIKRASEALARSAFPGLVSETAGKETARDCHKSALPRLLASCTILHLRLSRNLAEKPVRRRHLALARASADRFADLVPGSAVALAQQAMIESFTEKDRGTARALAALEGSYQKAAIQRDVSLWRVSYGARHWPALSPMLRKSVYDEATWLVRLGGSDRKAVMRELAGTALYLPVALRLPGRHGDALPPADIAQARVQALPRIDHPAH